MIRSRRDITKDCTCGTSVTARDADGAERAWLASSGTEGCEVGLAFAGNIVARMQVDPTGTALMYLADPTGTPVTQLTAHPA